MKEEIKTFEIYCKNFSVIIQESDLVFAVFKFKLENPKEEIINAVNIAYKKHFEKNFNNTFI